MKNPIKHEERGLCFGCRWVQRILVHERNQPEVVCGRLDQRIRGTVAECSMYLARGGMTLTEMERAAWILKGGVKIGFVRPGSKEHRELRDKGAGNMPSVSYD